ncbi:hypothetical protein HCA64_08855 [Listeria booriae]|uniref:hypothetical protein n=1 Tax=Listeria booriae TaxID=1552123 RepID=UPI0016273E68|nr:hypothetical protein [Listeria booriae]MBC1906587.1 hypothetical protein [Listeria booriae]
MESVEKIIKKADEIATYYENELSESIEMKMVEFKSCMEKKLNKFCRKKRITGSNSVYTELHPFSLKARIKSNMSLKEKIIRDSMVFQIYNDDKTEMGKNIYEYVNDIIGITILLDTNRHLDLFAEFIFEEIKGNEKLESCSDKENSLKKFSDIKYYNIKLKYENLYPIEIQIKSNLLSSYTNLEHKLIYKNNKVSAVKQLNGEVIQAITPNLVAIENIIDTVEDSLNDALLQEFACTRQTHIEGLLMRKYTKNYNLISNYLEKIDFILYRSFKGSLILKRKSGEITSSELGEYGGYIKDITKTVDSLNIRGVSGEIFLSDILIEFVKDFKTLVKNLLIADAFKGKDIKDIDIKDIIVLKEEMVNRLVQLLEKEEFEDMSVARRLFDFDIKNNTYTNPISVKLTKVYDDYSIFINSNDIQDEERTLLNICMECALTGNDLSEKMSDILSKQNFYGDSDDLIAGMLNIRRNR